MDQRIVLKDIHEDHSKKAIHEIYYQAFDPSERFSFEFLFTSSCRKDVKMYAVHEDESVIGFCYLVIGETIVYLEYLAISSQYRDKGFGTKIIEIIKQNFPGKAILIDMEDAKQDPDGYRLRCHFYTVNGFYPTPYNICYDDHSTEELWITDPSVRVDTALMSALLQKQFTPEDLAGSKEHLPVVFPRRTE